MKVSNSNRQEKEKVVQILNQDKDSLLSQVKGLSQDIIKSRETEKRQRSELTRNRISNQTFKLERKESLTEKEILDSKLKAVQ